MAPRPTGEHKLQGAGKRPVYRPACRHPESHPGIIQAALAQARENAASHSSSHIQRRAHRKATAWIHGRAWMMLLSTLTLATARAPSLAGRHHLRIVESGVFTRAKRWRARDVGSRTRTCAHAPAMTGQLHASRSHRPTLMERSRGETSATGLRDRTCHCSPSLSTSPSGRGGAPEATADKPEALSGRGARSSTRTFFEGRRPGPSWATSRAYSSP